MEQFKVTTSLEPEPQQASGHAFSSEAWAPPAMAAHTLGDRLRDRQQQHEPRHPFLHNLIDRIHDGGGLAGLLQGLGQNGDVQSKLHGFVDFVGDVKGVNVGFSTNGKLKLDIERGHSGNVPINEKQGPVTVKSLDLSDHIGFEFGRDGTGVHLNDIHGLKVNVQLGAGFLSKDMTIDVRSATLATKDGKPALNLEVSQADTPWLKFPVSIPLQQLKH